MKVPKFPTQKYKLMDDNVQKQEESPKILNNKQIPFIYQETRQHAQTTGLFN